MFFFTADKISKSAISSKTFGIQILRRLKTQAESIYFCSDQGEKINRLFVPHLHPHSMHFLVFETQY